MTGETLTIGIENGNNQDVSLATFALDADVTAAIAASDALDGDTDDMNEIQNITSNDASVTITPNGNDFDLSVVGGTDNQNIEGSILTGETLTIGAIVFGDTDMSLTSDDTELFWDATNNRLGIGTNTPTANAQVHLSKVGGNQLQYAFQLQNEDGVDSGNSATGMLFSVEDVGDFGKGGIVYERKAGFGRGDFHILQNSDTNTNIPNLNDAVMTIKNTGEMGLGTTTPNTLLHLNESGGNALSYALELQNSDGTNTGGSATGMLFSVEAVSDYGKGGLVYERTDTFARGDFHFLQESTNNSVSPTLADAVMTIKNDGDVGIGTIDPQENLHVVGNIRADGSFLSTDPNIGIPDYVFQKYFDDHSDLNQAYDFKSLEEIERFVKTYKHLPGITSVDQAKKDGYWNVTESNLQNLEKIEELFLHTIEQEKKIKSLETDNERLTEELEAMKKDMALIKAMLLSKTSGE